jgi:hypothetical protein
MNQSTQTAAEPLQLDPAESLREELAGHFQPASGYERLLVDAAAHALERYQAAQKLERRLFEKVDPLELLTNQPDTFKMITRHVESCERVWRKALEEIRRAIRQCETPLDAPNARRTSQRHARPAAQSAAIPNTQVPPAAVHARRE